VLQMKSERDFPPYLIIIVPLVIGLVFSLEPRPIALQKDLTAALQTAASPSAAMQANHLQDILTWEPWRTDLWETVGQKSLDGGDPAAAIKAFQTAEWFDRLSPEGWISLGDAFLAAGDWQKAVSAWQDVLTSTPGDDLFNRVLTQQWNHQDYPDALQTALSWWANEPKNSQAAFKAGLLECVENPPEALKYLANAAGLDSKLSSQVDFLIKAVNGAYQQSHEGYRRVMVGRALANLGYWDLAQRSFADATTASPDYAEGWAFLGEALQQLNQDGTAELKKAQSLDPTSIIVKALTALWDRRNNQIDAAFTELKQIAQLQPDQAIWQIELGNTTALTGDLYASLQYYQHATELEPANPQTWMALGNFSVVNFMQLREVGLPAARTALNLTSTDSPALDLMGRVMMDLEDMVSAERFLQQAVDKDASSAAAQLHLGQLYLQENQPEKAYPHLKLASQLAGSDGSTRTLANRLLVRYFGGQ